MKYGEEDTGYQNSWSNLGKSEVQGGDSKHKKISHTLHLRLESRNSRSIPLNSAKRVQNLTEHRYLQSANQSFKDRSIDQETKPMFDPCEVLV